MKKRNRHQTGNAKKWIETPYARKYLEAQIWRRAYMGGIAMMASANISQIAATPANSAIEKVMKGAAIAQAQMAGLMALNNAIDKTASWGK